jgi:hypothetical protein
MAYASVTLRRMSLSVLMVALVASGWASPAAAASRYAEAPMQVMTEGLTAEEHLLRQVELSQRLLAELPLNVQETRVPLSATEAAAIDQGPRRVSPLKIGLVKPMAPRLAVAGLERGSLSRTADGGLVWAAVVRAEEAGAIRLHVQGLSLPRNAELYVYSRGGQAHGPYTGTGPNGTGSFWSTAVFGSETILQLRLSAPVRRADLRAVSFRIAEAALMTKKFAGSLRTTFEESSRPSETAAACGNPNCVVDATCISNTQANAAKLAVAKMEWVQGAFIYTCTGGLITDTNPTQSNFFLTANHCFSKNAQAQNASFYWKFATSACNSTICPSNGGWPFVTTGSTVSSTNRKSDYTLVRLNSNPPAGSIFLGWTSAPVANTNGAALYRVSNPNFGPQVYSTHSVDTAVGTCSGWPRGQWIYSRDTTGAIDGGSSGSPVINASGQVVGQLSGTCGLNPSDPCGSGPGESNATVDGAFASFFATIKPIINP